jgi:hypothetical protein
LCLVTVVLVIATILLAEATWQEKQRYETHATEEVATQQQR